LARQSAGMRIGSVSFSAVPFACEDLFVRITSNGLTWDSASSSRLSIDQDGDFVCPVNFSVAEDVIISIYSSSFVQPIFSLAFHTLVSFCTWRVFCFSNV
jgi:hypothetical protein